MTQPLAIINSISVICHCTSKVIVASSYTSTPPCQNLRSVSTAVLCGAVYIVWVTMTSGIRLAVVVWALCRQTRAAYRILTKCSLLHPVSGSYL